MPLPRLRILCVDGDEDTSSLETLLFEQQNFEVITAKDVADALAIARCGNIQMYLIAQKLAEGTGIELCRRIREFDKRTPILFWSALVYECDRALALDAGANAFLRKPNDLDLLVETATRLICKADAATA